MEVKKKPSSKSKKIDDIILKTEDTSDIKLPAASNDYRDLFYDTSSAIIFDMGSQSCRVGWSTENDPRYNFESIVSKYRERVQKGGGTGKSQINVGSGVHSTIIGKANLRTPFDGNIINSIEHVEHIMDYSFLNLGIDTSSIEHPIVFTEPAGNLMVSRNMVTELIFECYQAPSLSYGVDGLFSYFYNNNGNLNKDGLVISAGHHCTNLIPIYDSRSHMDQSYRIAYGGFQAADYMLKSMQLKFPMFPQKMTFQQAQYIMEGSCFLAKDYSRTLRKLGPNNDIDYFNDIDVTIQFPYTEPTAEEKSVEELEKIAQRRKEQSERLREAIQRKKKEKVHQREQELENLLELKASKSQTSKAAFLSLLQDYDLENEKELDLAIQGAEKALRRAQEVALGIEVVEEKVVPNFDLVDVPDDELSEDSRREKKKQRLLKAGYDARERLRKAKEEAELAKAEEARKDEEFRKNDFKGWLASLRAKHDELYEKIQARKKLKSQLSDRRSHASQQRMRSIANLAKENKASNPNKRTRKRNGDDDDTFGVNDADWNVYRKISKEEDSEDEEDANQLAQFEALLLENDPEFQTELEAKSGQNGFNPTKSFLHRFQFGTKFNNWEEMEDIKYHHQLHVNVERVKIPEVLFQPSILGIDQAGIEEVLNSMFQRIGVEKQTQIVKNTILTGGFSQLRGLQYRVESILRRLSPAGTQISVRLADDPVLDAWRGAALFARNGGLTDTPNAVLTREQYFETGHDYFLDHGLGNWV